MRGTYYSHGMDAGVFAFNSSYGQVRLHVSFRVVWYYVKDKKKTN